MKDYNVIIENLTEGIITNLEEAYDYGYKQGYEDGRNNTEYMVSSAYQQGLNDAWEAAKKVARMDTETSENVTGYFGLFRIMDNLTAAEAIEKLKAYEQKQDAIQVWDEVYSEINDLRFIVTRITTSKHMDITVKRYEGICTDGACYDNLPEDIVKTGRTFPQIAEVLNEMRCRNESD